MPLALPTKYGQTTEIKEKYLEVAKSQQQQILLLPFTLAAALSGLRKAKVFALTAQMRLHGEVG